MINLITNYQYSVNLENGRFTRVGPTDNENPELSKFL